MLEKLSSYRVYKQLKQENDQHKVTQALEDKKQQILRNIGNDKSMPKSKSALALQS